MANSSRWSLVLASTLLGSQLVHGAAYAQNQVQQEKQGEVHSPAIPAGGFAGSDPAELTADQVEALEQKADALYEAADYAGAAELYEQIVAWRQTSLGVQSQQVGQLTRRCEAATG